MDTTLTTAPGVRSDTATGVGMSLMSMGSVQVGAALAAGLFDAVPASVVVMIRQVGAALILLAWQRPRLGGRSRADWVELATFGLVLAGMNLCFYAAVDRLPLGVTVTIELLGPLAVSVVMSKRRSDYVLIGIALVGVLMLGERGDGLSISGVGFALAAALGWGAYIVLSHRSGRHGVGLDRLAISLTIASLTSAPFAVHAGVGGIDGRVIGIGALVAVLSALVPFSLDMQALRRLAPSLFGLLQSLSPVVATCAGWLMLGQGITTLQAVGTGIVVSSAAFAVTHRSRELAGR